jgi:hypothetical protein
MRLAHGVGDRDALPEMLAQPGDRRLMRRRAARPHDRHAASSRAETENYAAAAGATRRGRGACGASARLSPSTARAILIRIEAGAHADNPRQ